MRNWSIVMVLIAVAVGRAAIAEPISVISGEHDGFTRLVLELPEDTEWQITSEAGKSILSLDGFDGGFDLTRAFAIIPRTRLTALVARDSELEMQLACDCPVQSSVEQGRFLVLDISDGTTIFPPFERETLSSDLPSSEFGVSDLIWSQSGFGLTAQKNPDASDETSIAENEGAENEQIDEVLKQTQERLLQSFSDAASRGIINLTGDLEIDIGKDVPDVVAPEIFDASNVEISDPRSNIRVTSSSEISVETKEVTNLEGSVCPNSDIVNVRDWSNTDDFNQEIAVSNANLYDEAGRLRPNEVLKRARLYIYFGFGAEAREALNMVENLSLKYPELFDLASILEEGFTKNPRYLHQFSDCESDLALWAMLSPKDLQTGNAANPDTALRALKKLPTHLQFVLSKSLADRFAQIGDTQNAQITLRNYGILEESSESAHTVISAQLGKNATREPEILSGLIAQNDVQTPEALVRLIDYHVENNMAISADVALLAEAFATELRNSEEIHDILRAFILASIKSSQFPKAFAALHDTRLNQIDGLKTELVSLYFDEIAETADDATFLDHVFRQFPEYHQFANQPTFESIASRLVNLGFASEAKQISAMRPEATRTGWSSFLEAQIAFNQNDYVAAIQHLEGLDDQSANSLRGDAFMALGEPEMAANAYRSAQNGTLAGSALWLSERWIESVEHDDPVFGAIKSIASENPESIIGDDNMLANTKVALDASASAREVVEQLLQTLELPE